MSLGSFFKKEKTEGFKFLKSMQKLEVKDGDVIILITKNRLSGQASERLAKSVKEALEKCGMNIRIIVLEEGLKIGVLRKEVLCEHFQ